MHARTHARTHTHTHPCIPSQLFGLGKERRVQVAVHVQHRRVGERRRRDLREGPAHARTNERRGCVGGQQLKMATSGRRRRRREGKRRRRRRRRCVRCATIFFDATVIRTHCHHKHMHARAPAYVRRRWSLRDARGQQRGIAEPKGRLGGVVVEELWVEVRRNGLGHCRRQASGPRRAIARRSHAQGTATDGQRERDGEQDVEAGRSTWHCCAAPMVHCEETPRAGLHSIQCGQ